MLAALYSSGECTRGTVAAQVNLLFTLNMPCSLHALCTVNLLFTLRESFMLSPLEAEIWE